MRISVSCLQWEMNNKYDGLKPARHRYRMIAIDMDGTLLSPKGEVTQRTKEAIHRALGAGLLVCFATGRSWTESKLILEAVAHYPTAVFVGGAIVVDTRREVTLHRTLMDPKLAGELCAFFENQGQAAMAVQDKGTSGVDYLISERLPMHAACENWMTDGTMDLRREADLSGYPHEHTMRVSIVAPMNEVNRISPLLEQAFGDRVVHHSMATAGVAILEVFDPAVNKWEGLLKVAANHGIDPKDIIAIGDDVNDLPMIRNAGLGVAMGNAKPEVQAAAKRVIGKNSEDGLARFLEELVIEHEVAPLQQ